MDPVSKRLPNYTRQVGTSVHSVLWHCKGWSLCKKYPQHLLKMRQFTFLQNCLDKFRYFLSQFIPSFSFSPSILGQDRSLEQPCKACFCFTRPLFPRGKGGNNSGANHTVYLLLTGSIQGLCNLLFVTSRHKTATKQNVGSLSNYKSCCYKDTKVIITMTV